MATIGSTIIANNKSFTVRESYNQGGIRVPGAFQKYKDIIRHKDLDFVYTDPQTRQKYRDVLREIYPVMSRLMGANSMHKGEIVPLGELQKENGVFYVEGEFRGETTRFYLFTEAQAKQMGIDLTKPAFAVIEDGYNIVDKSKDSYAIHVPENALPNLRLFYGRYESGQLRYVEQEFNAPLGEIAGSFDATKTRRLYYYKPGPAVRGVGDVLGYFSVGVRFDVLFGVLDDVRPYRFGVLTENGAPVREASAIGAKVTKADVEAKINELLVDLPNLTDAQLKLKVAEINELAKSL
ncbi:MAG: hypothetical protein NTX79_00360 [Candidatus Micrarchaeota archaeon]|nr:hypothetical protein [Candidatus Micrarchaeota archaeon]